jgi:peptide/nickel transport system substrate-binding protein
VFRLQTDVHGAPERFLRGEADITCGTAFPLDRLDEWRGNSAMHRAPTGIYMQVEPNPSGEGPLADPSLRRAMSGCLDLASIAASFPGGLRPVSPHVGSARTAADIPPRLCISYHDFYPNRSVLDRLSMQWRDRLGMDIELVERDYADWGEDDADGSFVLRYLPFNHPYAYFDQCATLMADPAFDILVRRFAGGDEQSLVAMNHRVQEERPMIRLFEVIGNWLSNPRVTGFSWPTDAVFDFVGLRRVDGETDR